MTRNNVATTYTDKSGKFAKGNPGRPKGSRHKHVLAIQDLLDGEAETLGRKAIDLALAGDTTALRLCIERIAPARKDSPVAFDLPTMTNAQQAASAAQGVLQAVSLGDMTPPRLRQPRSWGWWNAIVACSSCPNSKVAYWR
jgi:hypothetical protein